MPSKLSLGAIHSVNVVLCIAFRGVLQGHASGVVVPNERITMRVKHNPVSNGGTRRMVFAVVATLVLSVIGVAPATAVPMPVTTETTTARDANTDNDWLSESASESDVNLLAAGRAYVCIRRTKSHSTTPIYASTGSGGVRLGLSNVCGYYTNAGYSNLFDIGWTSMHIWNYTTSQGTCNDTGGANIPGLWNTSKTNYVVVYLTLSRC